MPCSGFASPHHEPYGYSYRDMEHHFLDANCLPQHLQSRDKLLCLIKSCSTQKNLSVARKVHAELLRKELLLKDVHVCTALLSAYVKCGALEDARKVFEQLPTEWNVVSWNAMISGYANHGLYPEAIDWFKQMQDAGITPNEVTFVCVSRACGSTQSLDIADEIYATASKEGFLRKHDLLGTALMDMYAKCGVLCKAQEIFDELPARDVVSWTALISGYARHGLADEALKCYLWMQDEGISPNVITYVGILKSCSSVGSLKLGEQIHVEVDKQGLLNKSIALATALVDMYSKCGVLGKAQGVFDNIYARDIICWNALITGYAEHGFGHEALKLFRCMQEEGIFPNTVTFICALKACTAIQSINVGKEIHAKVGNQRLLENNVMLHNTLVDMYAKCGVLREAQKVFDEIPRRSAASWTTLMSGYVQHGLINEAHNCIMHMKNNFIALDAASLICIAKACSSMALLELGEQIFSEISTQGMLKKEIALGNTLVDMYARCGMLGKAQEVFKELAAQDIISWNALMAGYAQMGLVKQVFGLFMEMVTIGTKPDLVTFLALLTACNHSGLVDEGQVVDDMCTVYHLSPTMEHYSCLVDMFSRSGQIERAVQVVFEKTPESNYLPLWLALLGASCKSLNTRLATWVFKHSMQLDDHCSAAYICMGNMYASADMYVEAW